MALISSDPNLLPFMLSIGQTLLYGKLIMNRSGIRCCTVQEMGAYILEGPAGCIFREEVGSSRCIQNMGVQHHSPVDSMSDHLSLPIFNGSSTNRFHFIC